MTSRAVAVDGGQEREAFAVWACRRGMDLNRNLSGCYIDAAAELAWCAWRHRAEHDPRAALSADEGAGADLSSSDSQHGNRLGTNMRGGDATCPKPCNDSSKPATDSNEGVSSRDGTPPAPVNEGQVAAALRETRGEPVAWALMDRDDSVHSLRFDREGCQNECDNYNDPGIHKIDKIASGRPYRVVPLYAALRVDEKREAFTVAALEAARYCEADSGDEAKEAIRAMRDAYLALAAATGDGGGK